MKNRLGFLTILMALLFASCNAAPDADAKEVDTHSANVATELAPDQAVAKVDTSLSTIGDSLKADVNNAANKIKQHTKELSSIAKEKANKGVDELKKGAHKVKEATKAGVDAVKEELKKP